MDSHNHPINVLKSPQFIFFSAAVHNIDLVNLYSPWNQVWPDHCFTFKTSYTVEKFIFSNCRGGGNYKIPSKLPPYRLSELTTTPGRMGPKSQLCQKRPLFDSSGKHHFLLWYFIHCIPSFWCWWKARWRQWVCTLLLVRASNSSQLLRARASYWALTSSTILCGSMLNRLLSIPSSIETSLISDNTSSSS